MTQINEIKRALVGKTIKDVEITEYERYDIVTKVVLQFTDDTAFCFEYEGWIVEGEMICYKGA